MVLDVVLVLAVWLVIGGLLALALSRTLRVRDRREARPRPPGGSAAPGSRARRPLLTAR